MLSKFSSGSKRDVSPFQGTMMRQKRDKRGEIRVPYSREEISAMPTAG